MVFRGSVDISFSIENVYTGEVTNYINNKNLNDMRDTLYEFHINVTESNWRKHIVETMTNISTEIECGAIAALYFPHEIDFYRYESHECFLGDMTQTKEEDTGLTNNSLIKIHKCEYILHSCLYFDSSHYNCILLFNCSACSKPL